MPWDWAPLEEWGASITITLQRESIMCTNIHSWQSHSFVVQFGCNVGGGGGHTQYICVRLRHSTSEFYPWQVLLHTMLHELTHNHIGPHNDSFYAMLKEMETVSAPQHPPPLPLPNQAFPLLGVF